jgi:SAM-dependent methyltransferase
MNFILNLIPRKYLIRISIFLRPILKIYFKGSKYTDPIDNSKYRKFLPYGYGKNIRKNALCPGTLSLERHRLLWLFLERNTTFFNDKLKVLHFAPEQPFYKKFKSIKNWNYITCDLNSPLADIKADICKLPFKNFEFDLIICNHVLEHIDNDFMAMEEIYRVLKKNGIGILQVPIDESLSVTFEDKTIIDPKKKSELFGQYDHVRKYGKDFYDRLKSVGFKVKKIDVQKNLSEKEIKEYCLPKCEKIPFVIKS